MKKAKQGMLVIFCVILFGGALSAAVMPDRDYSVRENRELAQKPEFSIKGFLTGKFQTEYESYLDDQFPLRDRWVGLSSQLQALTGRKEINGIYLGKEGYLLEKTDEKEFDEEQVKENVEYLSSFLNDMVQVYGKEHVSCVMLPSKAQALPKRLPSFADAPEHSRVLNSLKNRLSVPDIFIDMEKTLRMHQDEYIYYRTDHHWTTLGAYYAFQSWAEQTGQAVSYPLEHYERETVFTDFYGTTYNKAQVDVPADAVEIFHTPAEKGIHIRMVDEETESDSLYFYQEAREGFDRYHVFFSKNTFRIEVNTKAKTGKRLLLMKDSFANCFVPFLTEDYEQIIMLDYRYGKLPVGTILNEYEGITDVLVMFNTEKFMQNTKLDKLADTRTESQTMEEFDPESFFE